MPFKGVTFSGQNVTPKNDGGLYNAHYGDGILWGCSMNISGDDLVIQSGEFIACGRVCQVDGATNVDLSGRTLQTGYIQVLMNYDISQGEGSQWYTTFVESATITFPALTQNDINNTGTLYQLELAVVQISGGNLTSITSSIPYSGIIVNNGNSIFYNDSNINVQQELQFYINNDFKGKIFMTPDGPSFMRTNSSGSSINGLALGPSSILSAGGGSIEFRPNGWNSSIGEVYIDSTGQFIGGAKFISTSGSNVSVTANTTKGIGSINLVVGGAYMIWGTLQFTASSSTGTHRQIGFSSVSGTLGSNTNTVYMATSSAARHSISIPWDAGVSTIYLNFNPGNSAGTVNAWEIRALRIA